MGSPAAGAPMRPLIHGGGANPFWKLPAAGPTLCRGPRATRGEGQRTMQNEMDMSDVQCASASGPACAVDTAEVERWREMVDAVGSEIAMPLTAALERI